MVLVIGEDNNLVLLTDRNLYILLVAAEKCDLSAGLYNAQEY